MTSQATSTDCRKIVLYDGLCGMCDGVVQFLLRHDKRDAFRFAPQQGQAARQILGRQTLQRQTPDRHALGSATGFAALDTICVIENYESPQEQVYTKSDAALRIADGLGGIWTFALAARLLPRSFRDACYDLVARNRYRIFGRRTECRIPTADDRHKFLG
jgi:predicted DCC family thiol-disulfide oxidoreductase YuxK